MPTLAAALTTFLKLDRAPTTARQYTYILSKLVSAIGPARDCQRVTYEDLVDYVNTLDVTRSTKAGYVAIYKAFFTWCVESEYTPASPAARLKKPRKQTAPAESRAIPPAELRAIVEYVRVDSPRNYALLLFLADTACRVGGLLSLTLDNLHVEDGYAWIFEKGGKWHRANYGVDTAAALQRWLHLRPKADHSFVWTGQGPDYETLKPPAVRYIVRTLSSKVGCTREWFPHAIRHAVAYAWADAGVAPTLVQAKLGHSSASITLENYYPHDDARLVTTSNRLALQALKTPDRDRFAPVPLPIPAAAPRDRPTKRAR